MIWLFILLMSPNSYADTARGSTNAIVVNAGVPGNCNCKTPLSPNEFKRIVNFKDILDRDYTKYPDALTQEDKELLNFAKNADSDMKKACDDFFIGKDGKFGDLTVYIAKHISADMAKEGNSSVFLQDYPDISEICPNFQNLTGVSKVGLWTWIFQNLAFEESSCDPTQQNFSSNVPNPPALGLYQMEPRQSERAWRGKMCNVSNDVIMTPQGNTGCAFEIMRGQLKTVGRLIAKRDKDDRVSGYRYWETIVEPVKRQRNPSSKHAKIKGRISQFPLCSQKT